ncbi:CHAT domain-containing protein [Leptothermofonsia sp. ETS-13]|uniref:CHAT domain-containing protein n=1 Tax=Leptothermofonsia sp. ETS-13 TaxID=3035696 RepID=UPI003B9F484E
MPVLVQMLDAGVVRSQSITPAIDGTGSIVTPNGNRYDISGGKLSRDGANLFQSFQRFGLNQGEIANFLSSPAVQNILGRVVGGDPSMIHGLIQVTGSNANLFLVNPAGIVFGPTARLNVPGSFLATTANGVGFGCERAGVGCGGWLNAVGTNDYATLVGTPNTFAFTMPEPGAIANLGNLALSQGQALTLLGGTVLNTGTLSAPGGQITIAAVPGESLVRISQSGSLLSLEITSAPPSAPLTPFPPLTPLTLPQLLTGNNLGSATGVGVNADGTIQLTGSGISIPAAAGDAIASGQISTARSSPIPDAPRPTPQIAVLGDRVALLAATLDASSLVAAGTIRIGGDYQGQGMVPNAARTFVSSDSVIRADGLQTGSGGRVIVWANEGTQFLGTITARGGATAGDGGFVEVSGAQNLSFQGTVNTSAAAGNAGTLLLDPDTITIVPGTTPVSPNLLDGIWGFFEDPGNQNIGADTISTLLNSNSLRLQSNEDININASITYTGAANRDLIFQATNSISQASNVQITSTAAPLNVVLESDANGSGAPGSIVLNPGAAINSNGGNILLGGGVGGFATGTAVNPHGVELRGATLNSAGGNIAIRGQEFAGGVANRGGVAIDNGSLITSGNGTIAITGIASGTTGNHVGVNIGGPFLGGNVVISSSSPSPDAIAINGSAPAGNTTGVLIQGNSTLFTTSLPAGGVSVSGVGGTGTIITGSTIGTTGGPITLSGSGSNNESPGLTLRGNAQISSGGGEIRFTGTATGAGNFARGIEILGAVNAQRGAIAFTGTSANAEGIVTFVPVNSGGGPITFDGTSTGTGVFARGIALVAPVDSSGGAINFTGRAINAINGITTFTFGTPETSGTINAGSGDITLTTDSTLLQLPITGSGNLLLQPLTPGLNLAIGGGGAFLGAPELFSNTFRSITIGREDGGGAIILAGNATFNAPVTLRSPAGSGSINTQGFTITGTTGVTLQAADTITLGAGSTITSAGAPLDVVLNANRNGDGVGAIVMNPSSAINSNGGNIVLGGGINPLLTPAAGTAANPNGVLLNNAILNSGTGAISIRGAALDGASGTSFVNSVDGIQLANSSLVQSTSGTITLVGTGGNLASVNNGIKILNSARITSGNGNIHLTGNAGGGGTIQRGIQLLGGGVVETTGAGNITLTGTSGNGGTDFNDGIDLNSNAVIRSLNGNIVLNGTGGNGTGVQNSGIVIFANSLVESTGTGSVIFNGTGGNGGTKAEGILVQNNATVRATSGDVRLTGTAGNGTNDNQGIRVEVGSTIQTGNGNLSLTGFGNGAGQRNFGIKVIGGSNVRSTGSGNITLVGTGSPLGSGFGVGNEGISISTNSVVESVMGNGSITLTADEMVLAGPVSGTGNLVLQPLTVNQAIALGGNSDSGTGTLDLQSSDLAALQNGFSTITIGRADGYGVITLAGDATFNDPVTLQSPSAGGVIDIRGGILIGADNATLSLIANQLITTGNISNPGRAIRFFSSSGDVTLGSIDTGGSEFSLSTAGTLTITGSITTRGGNLNLGGATINALGTLDTSNSEGGGAIALIARDRITTGAINSSSAIANGGNVTLDPEGDIQVGFINAQGGSVGRGGDINIITRRFFRAVESFTDQNGVNSSLSTAGGLGGGSIAIRHRGGLLRVPFIIGDSSLNGTQGAITTGASNTIPPLQEFLVSFFQGTSPNQVQIITEGSSRVDVIQQTLQQEGTGLTREEFAAPNAQLPPTSIPPVPLDPIVAPIEDVATSEFSNFLNLPKQPPTQTLVSAQSTLQRIEMATGIKPALIYVRFAPKIARQEQDDDNLEVVLVTAQGEPVRKLLPEVTRKQVLELARTFRKEASDPRKTRLQTYLPAAQQLYQWIIAPLESALVARKVNNLAFILDGGMRSLPLAALHDGRQFLVERYSIGLMPSLSLTDPRYVDLRQVPVLTAGVSQFDDQSALPAVTVELSAITKNLHNTIRLLDDSFTLSNLKQRRQDQPFGIIHLATHGEFLPGKLSDSYIQFWDTRLRLDQLRLLKWYDPPVEMVVLSACRMAVGDETTELGFAGVAAQSGAKSVVASLWYVSDEGTAGLMAEFYRWLRLAPIRAEALRQAQIAMLRGNVRLQAGKLVWSGGQSPLPDNLVNLGVVNEPLSHPYYWASFTMIGSPW